MEEKEDIENIYERDIEIDSESLDLEWLRHPIKATKYSRLKAKAKLELNQAEENVKTIRSELILKARKGGQDLLGVKPTDSVVEAWYRTQDEYIEAIENRNKKEFEYNILEGAVYNFQDRKAALENLVKLLGMDYFSAPREPRDLSRGEITNRAIKQGSSEQRKKLKRRSKENE